MMTPMKFATGYIPQVLPDEAVERYSVRSLMASLPEVEPTKKMWGQGPLLNQRMHPACVGFGWTDEFTAAPAPERRVAAKVATAYALNHWRAAQYLYFGASSFRTGTEYRDEGTSVLSAAQVAVTRGLIDEYRWAQTIEEIRSAVVGVGPVIIGIPWLDSMSNCTRDGLIRVNHKRMVGDAWQDRHCVVLTGYHPAKRFAAGTFAAYRVRNSWGKFWGAETKSGYYSGTGWLKESDLGALIEWQSAAFKGQWVDAACLPIGRNPVDLEALLQANPDGPTQPPWRG